MTGADGGSITFVWDQFADYHADRCEAVGAALGRDAFVQGIEIATASATYGWSRPEPRSGFQHIILFPKLTFEQTGWLSRARRLIAVARRSRAVFLTGYERPDNFLAAIALRLMGRQVIIMNDSKFNDKPRRAYFEIFKRLALAPYSGALVAGAAHQEYLRFLGFRGPIAHGYDTLSLERVRRFASAEAPARSPGAPPFLFVGRLVEKKNVETLVHAYHQYSLFGSASPKRGLVIAGDGPLRSSIEQLVEGYGLQEKVLLAGFLSASAVAAALADAHCLLVPSLTDQWGLIVNEALAFALPILASTELGATETLVRSHVNGFLIEPRNVEGWASAMLQVDQQSEIYQRFKRGSAQLAEKADVGRFVEGVSQLLR